MKLEHFWYGLTNGDGYIFKRSNRVLSILKEGSLSYLQGLPARKTCYVSWLPQEQTVAITTVNKAKDKDGRQGVINHTILIPIKQYISMSALTCNLPSLEIPESNVLEALEVNP